MKLSVRLARICRRFFRSSLIRPRRATRDADAITAARHWRYDALAAFRLIESGITYPHTIPMLAEKRRCWMHVQTKKTASKPSTARNAALAFALAALAFALTALSTVKPAFGQESAAASAPAASSSTLNGNWGVPEGRMLFPHDWARGYADFSLAPPHNEPDLGRCSAVLLNASSTCNDYARYLLSGYLEIQPVGRTILRHAFFFWQPMFSFGRNIPQIDYTWSMAPIAYDRALGLGFELPKNLEFRLTQHQVDWLGRYSNNNLGAADLHTNGPYGLYTTVGVRWYFGGYGRSHQ
jgi:hypothetical protein